MKNNHPKQIAAITIRISGTRVILTKSKKTIADVVDPCPLGLVFSLLSHWGHRLAFPLLGSGVAHITVDGIPKQLPYKKPTLTPEGILKVITDSWAIHESIPIF